MTSMDVLVLGGSGLLGPALCAALVNEGHRVHAFHRGTCPDRVAPGVTTWQGDRRSIHDLARLERIPCDVLIDTLGWYPETMPAIAARCRAGVRKAILLSSVAVYAGGSADALTETSATGVNRAWAYVGGVKRSMEEAYRGLIGHGPAVAIVRPSHICSFEAPFARSPGCAPGSRRTRSWKSPTTVALGCSSWR